MMTADDTAAAAAPFAARPQIPSIGTARAASHATAHMTRANDANPACERHQTRDSAREKNAENTTCDSHGICMNAKPMIVENITPSSL